MRQGRSQTGMKIEIVDMFTCMRPVRKPQNFQFIPLASFLFSRWLLLGCVVPMSRLQPRPV
jgi:hypothetical protein